MIILNDEQGSQEWLLSRLGKVSASSVSKLIGAQGKPSTQAQGYINQLIAETITGELPEQYTNSAMERGNELEPDARRLYEFLTDLEVVEVGFCLHDTIAAGFSPDGLVGDNGGLEIKCPQPHTHVEYLRAGKLPSKYKPQVMMALWISDRKWWDFMSYHPKMSPLIVRVERDQDYIDKLAKAVNEAAKVIDSEVERLATTGA